MEFDVLGNKVRESKKHGLSCDCGTWKRRKQCGHLDALMLGFFGGKKKKRKF